METDAQIKATAEPEKKTDIKNLPSEKEQSTHLTKLLEYYRHAFTLLC